LLVWAIVTSGTILLVWEIGTSGTILLVWEIGTFCTILLVWAIATSGTILLVWEIGTFCTILLVWAIVTSGTILFHVSTSDNFVYDARDRCYDLKNIFVQNLPEKWLFWLETMLKNDHNIGFWEKRLFFRRKLPKIVKITSTPGAGGSSDGVEPDLEQVHLLDLHQHGSRHDHRPALQVTTSHIHEPRLEMARFDLWFEIK
jgi:hypothetical protein